MYLWAKYIMKCNKYYAKKLQLAQIYYQREFSRKVYDATIRIEQQIDNVLWMDEKGEKI